MIWWELVGFSGAYYSVLIQLADICPLLVGYRIRSAGDTFKVFVNIGTGFCHYKHSAQLFWVLASSVITSPFT